MDILSSGDPFGKRRLPVDRGIVVISPKAHRLFRPDGIDQARQLILGRACVHDGIERLPGGRPKSGRNSIQRTPGSRIDIYSRWFVHPHVYTDIQQRGVEYYHFHTYTMHPHSHKELFFFFFPFLNFTYFIFTDTTLCEGGWLTGSEPTGIRWNDWRVWLRFSTTTWLSVVVAVVATRWFQLGCPTAPGRCGVDLLLRLSLDILCRNY